MGVWAALLSAIALTRQMVDDMDPCKSLSGLFVLLHAGLLHGINA